MKRNTFLKSLLGLPFLFSGKPELKTIKRNPIIEFTPEVISKYNFGLYIIQGHVDVTKNPNYAATVCFKLGWTLGICVNNVNGEKSKITFPKYGMSNFLTDGWYHPLGNTKEEVCKELNEGKYRIMTNEELLYIIEHRSNNKQLFYE